MREDTYKIINGGNIGFNTANGFQSQAQVNNQSSIIGTNSVKINVGTKDQNGNYLNNSGNLNLTAALIANISNYNDVNAGNSGSPCLGGASRCDSTTMGVHNKGNTNIKGTIASTEGSINITSKNNTNITALKSASSSNTTSKGYSQTITLASSATATTKVFEQLINNLSASIGLGINKSKADSSSTTYDNTMLSAANGSLIINSKDNTTIKGANLLAQNLTLNTKNNLNIESLQNSATSKSKSTSFNIGAGGGSGGLSSISLGYNQNTQKFNRDWVDDQTTVIGTNSVNINTGGNTNLKGAVVANITNLPTSSLQGTNDNQIIQNFLKSGNAIDGGNLALNTGTLTIENIYDLEKQKSSGFGFSANIGLGTNSSTTNPNQDKTYYPTGSTTLSAQNEGYIKEQITKATIGNGTINIGGIAATNEQLAGLNRDINQSQEITKDTITGALNTSITLDNRIFSTTGRAQIGSEFLNQGGNLLTTTEAQNQLLLGVLPTPKTEGGLIGQAIAMFSGDQRKLQVEMSEETKLKIAQANKNQEGYVVSTNDNGERIVTFKDGSTAPLRVNKTDLDDFNSDLKSEVKNGAGNLVADLKVNKDNSLNGIMNNEDEAIKNGLKQMGVLQSNILNVLYDPTHGLASDLLEVGWNWALGKTLLKSGNLYELATYGQNVAQAAQQNDITGLRYVGHSGGGDRLYQGIIYSAEKGAFIYMDVNNVKQSRLSLQLYGAPVVNSNAIEASNAAGAKFTGHQINQDDYVGENLGWGNAPSTSSKILGPFNPVSIATKVPRLFLDSSPHSGYFCEGAFCGYDKLNINKNNQPRAP